MNSILAFVSVALVAFFAAAGTVPKQTSGNNLTLVNLTASDRDVFVDSSAGMISYGTPALEERVLLMPYSLIELDANYTPVATRLGLHYIPTLNTTQWTLGDMYATVVDGVNCTGVNMTATLSNHAILLVRTLLFEEDGLLASNLDQFNVTAGTLKVDLFIRGWTFCNSVSSRRGCLARGDYLQVDLALKALMDVIESINNSTYVIGPDTILIVNPEVEVDNEIYLMEQGYPLIFPAPSNAIIFDADVPNNYTTNILRLWIPRFSQYALWDAVIF